jgi:hypothetical protein
MAAAKGKSKNQLMIAGGVLAVLVIGGITVFEMQSAKREAEAKTALWTVQGATCPTGNHATPPPRGLAHEGATFLRQRASAVNCDVIQENGAQVPVCMFIGPGALRVTTESGTTDYAPPAGQNVTVYVRGGQPTCVMNYNQAVFAG